MTLPQTTELEIRQGKTLKQWFAVQFPDGEIADLPAEGYPIARLVVRPPLDEETYGPPVLTLTTANGGIVLQRQYDAPETDPQRMLWTGYWWASAATTAALAPWGMGAFEMEIDNGAGDVLAVLAGPAWLIPEVAK